MISTMSGVASSRVTVTNRGHRIVGWLHILGGMSMVVGSVVLTVMYPEALCVLVLAPVFGALAWFGIGLARARVVADEFGLEIRAWRTHRVPWTEVVSIDAPRPGEPSFRYDFTAAMARVLLTSGRDLPMVAVATWLRPTFWRSGTPRKLANSVAQLRTQQSRYRRPR
jgi:hypothetical protein